MILQAPTTLADFGILHRIVADISHIDKDLSAPGQWPSDYYECVVSADGKRLVIEVDIKCALYDLEKSQYVAPPGSRFESLLSFVKPKSSIEVEMLSDSQFPHVYPKGSISVPIERGAMIFNVTASSDMWCLFVVPIPGTYYMVSKPERPQLYCGAIVRTANRGPSPNKVFALPYRRERHFTPIDVRVDSKGGLRVLYSVAVIGHKGRDNLVFYKLNETGLKPIPIDNLTGPEKRLIRWHQSAKKTGRLYASSPGSVDASLKVAIGAHEGK